MEKRERAKLRELTEAFERYCDGDVEDGGGDISEVGKALMELNEMAERNRRER